MNVRVRLFAAARERAGTALLELSAPAGATLADLAQLLGQLHGEELRAELRAPGARVAVNQELVEWDHRLADGDEVAFLPQVTGG